MENAPEPTLFVTAISRISGLSHTMACRRLSRRRTCRTACRAVIDVITSLAGASDDREPSAACSRGLPCYNTTHQSAMIQLMCEPWNRLWPNERTGTFEANSPMVSLRRGSNWSIKSSRIKLGQRYCCLRGRAPLCFGEARQLMSEQIQSGPRPVLQHLRQKG